jgi:hypothetical protein
MPATIPPLVVSGQVISAAHINALRNAAATLNTELYAWAGNVAAGGFNLSGVGALSAASGTFTGGLSAASLSATTLTLTGALTGASCTFSGTATFNGAAIFAAGIATSAVTPKFLPQNAGAGEGGELQLADPTGSNVWVLDNFSQAFRLFRSGGGAFGFHITSSGSIGFGTQTTPFCKYSFVAPSQPFGDAASGGGAFSIGLGSDNTDDKLIIGYNNVGTTYAWLQAVKAGTATRLLALNPLGGSVQIGTGSWSTGPAMLGPNYFLWVDGSGRLRIKNGAPGSDTDGTVVGTQS